MVQKKSEVLHHVSQLLQNIPAAKRRSTSDTSNQLATVVALQHVSGKHTCYSVLPRKVMVTLHPFLGDFLHWRTRRTHRSTTLCRACGHTAHAVWPSSRQVLVGLRVECIKMEEQMSLLENLLLKVLLSEDERSDWANPIFDEREKCGEFHTLFPMLLEQAQTFFFFSEF